MDKTYIFGHKNPDTDSVTSAISLSYLKNKLGNKTVPCILGEVNNETKYVLEYFKEKNPVYLNDTRLQIKDINYKKNCFINYQDTIYNLYNIMQREEITSISIVNDKQKYMGIVSIKELLNLVIDPTFDKINTSFNNILKTIKGKSILQYTKELDGKIIISTFRTTDFEEKVDLTKNDILIIGDRKNIIKYAINKKIKLIIIVGGAIMSDDIINLAKKNKVSIIYTELDSLHTSKLIVLSNYTNTLLLNQNVLIEDNDYLVDFINIHNKYKLSNYTVVDKDKKVLGLLRLTDLEDKNPKKVVMVDHNEYSQSVLGIEEADILEIIDHHKIGNINTSKPINFRNMAVGSTNTIIYEMYREHNLTPPKNIAGLMLSGIISDTLIFHSPTTTKLDKTAAQTLAKIAGIKIQDYAKDMFEAGASIKGKTIEELIYNDFKVFNIKDKKIGIGQMTVINYESILKDKDKYLEIIEKIAEDQNYQVFSFCITDVINSNTYILYNENSKTIFETIFNIKDLYQGYKLKGVVSRKKQIIPLLMEELNN